MRGPSPKPGAINQNKPAHEWVNLPQSGNPNPTPELPARADDGVWSNKSRNKWQELWETPESLMWTDAGSYDWVVLYLHLMQQLDEGHITTSFLTGMKDCAKALGLTNPVKMQLRWRIVPDVQADPRFTGGKVEPDARPLASVKEISTPKRREVKYEG